MERLLVLFLATILAPPALFAAQSQDESTQKPIDASSWLKPAQTPKYAGTFSPRTGFVKDGKRNTRIGTRLVVNNGILLNYYATPGKGQEWVDNNTLYDLSSDHTEQVNGLQMIYCSADSNPNGVGVNLYIYDHSVYCSGPVNWPVSDCSYSLAGLPGGNNGSLACWIVTTDLYGVECNLTSDPQEARQMGWGQVWDNDTTGPWIADGGYGNTCSYTWWDRTASNANAFLGCYWFGCFPHEGFYLQLYGGPVDTNRYWAEDLAGTSTSFDNGQLDVDFEVKAGNTVTFQLSDPSSIGFDSMQLYHSPNMAGTAIPYRGGNVLIDPLTATALPIGATSQTYTVPAVMGDYYTQAACFSGGQLLGLSNGLRHQAL
jgi:hypothetical protein